MLQKALEHVKTVAIGGHMHPDGDCIGACMGLYQYLKECKKEIETDVYLEEIAECFSFIEATKEIRHTVIKEKEYDLFIALDCGDAGRLGFSEELFQKAKQTICIDHHISNQGFAQCNLIEPDASSTSELVYRELVPNPISKKVAECLYLGIVHDTGVFQYSCTSPETMEAAACLMRTGIRHSEIIDQTFYEKTYAQNQILGRALLESILLLDGQCIAAIVTRQEMNFFGLTPKDLEGIVSQLRVTKGVEVAIFMYETNPQEYKVSLRSNQCVDVSKVAQYFGGGGHKKAAGFTMAGSTYDVMNNLTRRIEDQLQEKQ
ncbi:MAG: bifunctional oligoribonuclease/PAP phosphatase NrnA [Lachnospiraceae bacterium]